MLPKAEQDVWEAYRYLFERSPTAAAKWYESVKRAILELDSMPQRFPAAIEAEELGWDLRQAHTPGNARVYRIVYRSLEKEREVHVLAIRHGARAPLTETMVENLIHESESLDDY